jgi:hypothetical protein
MKHVGVQGMGGSKGMTKAEVGFFFKKLGVCSGCVGSCNGGW